ncbi:1,4-alpha-glucan branching protein GlgB [Atopobium fossor]|uniref:1,4-alpha-glucan branching protein GlgB n=1 Tax=Atopobium fossor TaxID=39487 RepID=UPI000424355B|nr:1,4-alpha-glucan branching protein GlgB [Atopobium fossor]
MGISFPSRVVTDTDAFLMKKGEWYQSYEKMGAHHDTCDGKEGYTFTVWVPDVVSVSVVGSFNNWEITSNVLALDANSGIWSGFVAGVSQGDLYKYYIQTKGGKGMYKADPYAVWSECPPQTASRIFDIEDYAWEDTAWMQQRARQAHTKRPLNIYEVHLGSWKRHHDEYSANSLPAEGEKPTGSYLTYDELSDELVTYVKEMGYTHLELMPVMEHPFDGSWGYQITGYYAPTARYGNPKQFMHFIDSCHKAGIGVILDWVPGGFCRDEHGLASFNGSMLYEKEEHPSWGTYTFDFARGEVRSFLISNVLYWLSYYHIDGIRMDGVSSMLYLNFGVDDEKLKKYNQYGDEGDLDAIEFIRQTNSVVSIYFSDVMMIAEESTSWPLVTYPPSVGGLGFHYKWDMGWMNDTLHYMQTDFPYRPDNHKLLTFSLMYAFNENFVLPLSHDEVVHGKCSLITRMPGDYWRQFAGMRLLALYQMTHPGAKLNFMGNEIAQWIEWRYYESIEWFLDETYEAHHKQHKFIRELNLLYQREPALWQKAYEDDGFTWIDADNNEQALISYIRHGDDVADDIVIVLNFSPSCYDEFRIGVPEFGIWREIFNSDNSRFGGSGFINTADVPSEDVAWNGCDQSVVMRIPPLGGMVLSCVEKNVRPKNIQSAKGEK